MYEGLWRELKPLLGEPFVGCLGIGCRFLGLGRGGCEEGCELKDARVRFVLLESLFYPMLNNGYEEQFYLLVL